MEGRSNRERQQVWRKRKEEEKHEIVIIALNCKKIVIHLAGLSIVELDKERAENNEIDVWRRIGTYSNFNNCQFSRSTLYNVVSCQKPKKDILTDIKLFYYGYYWRLNLSFWFVSHLFFSQLTTQTRNFLY